MGALLQQTLCVSASEVLGEAVAFQERLCPLTSGEVLSF